MGKGNPRLSVPIRVWKTGQASNEKQKKGYNGSKGYLKVNCFGLEIEEEREKF